MVATWVYKFVAGSSPNFIAQNLLVTQNERRWTGDEISKSFDIYRRFVAFHLWPYDQGFKHQRNTAYINNRFEISF